MEYTNSVVTRIDMELFRKAIETDEDLYQSSDVIW